MKKIYKLIAFSLLLIFFPIGFSGCSDDDNGEIIVEEIPELELETESITVKVGSENKETLKIKQGAGEYNAFSLNENIVKAYIENDEVIIEGIDSGDTYIVIASKGNQYHNFPVTSYSDVIMFESKELELVSLLGHQGKITTHVVLGNYGYSIESNNEDVLCEITEKGEITILATSKPEDYIATLTVTDRRNISASLQVTIKATTKAFSEEELKEIKANNTRRYTLDGNESFYMVYADNKNGEDENGNIIYGWDYQSMIYYILSFKGGKTLGKKEEASFSYGEFGYTYEENIDLEIIKIDNTNIWGIFTFVKDETLHFGYFCDEI